MTPITILGPDGQPLRVEPPVEPQTASVRYLQREFDAHPIRGLTPARLQALLVAAERGDLVALMELAEDMEERDGHLYAEISKRRGAITKLNWSIEPPEGASSAEKKLTDQVREWIGDLVVADGDERGGFPMALEAMTDAIHKGFSPLEMVWQQQGTVKLPTLTPRPQRWFTASPDRRSLYLRSLQINGATDDQPGVQGEPLQPLAWLMHRHRAKSGYVTRMSLARVLTWPYLFKHFAVRDLAEFLEIYGLPLRVGSYPASATDEEKRRLMAAVVGIGHNAAGIIPQGMQMDFKAAASGTEVPFAAMWDRMDAVISKVILGQTLSASEGQHGTQALGQVHAEVRKEIGEADARRLEETITQQLIAPMVMVNVASADPRRLPRLQLDTSEAEDLERFATHLPKLASGGVQIPVSWVQKQLRIPVPQAGEAVLRGEIPPAAVPPAHGPGPGPGAAPAAPPRQAALAGTLPVATGLADQLIDELLGGDGWQPLIAPVVQPVLDELDQAIARGDSLAQFRDRLPELLQRMDHGALGEQLARTGFVAALAGAAGLDIDA